MNADQYIKSLTKQICASSKINGIIKEYRNHMEDHKEALILNGMPEDEAEQEVLKQMGDPVYAGKKLNKVYRKCFEWKILMCFIIESLVMILVRYVYPFETLPQQWANYLGIGIVCVGLMISAMEKYNDMPLFYAWAKNWNGGGLVNSATVLAISVLFFADSMSNGLYCIVAICVLMTAERYLIAYLRDQKEMRLLWEIGVAETKISYKGYGIINGKRIKMEAKEGVVQKGDTIMVVELHGFRPLVMSV